MLRGSLDDFTLSDIFRLLSFTKKTGKLEIVRGAGKGRVFFRDGEVYFAQSSIRREPLGQKLIRAGALTESSLMRALDHNAQTGERVGEVLLRDGSITEDQLVAGVRGQIEDAVFDLLRWDVGDFEFESHERFVAEIPISVSVENLIMEASRRLDELEMMQKKIPSTDVILVVAPSPPEGAREINITPDEWRLLVLVDGSRTVGDICRAGKLDEFTGFRTLYGLVSAGLVDVASLGPTADPSPIARPPIQAGESVPDSGDQTVVTGPRPTDAPGPGDDHTELDSEFGFEPQPQPAYEPTLPASSEPGEALQLEDPEAPEGAEAGADVVPDWDTVPADPPTFAGERGVDNHDGTASSTVESSLEEHDPPAPPSDFDVLQAPADPDRDSFLSDILSGASQRDGLGRTAEQGEQTETHEELENVHSDASGWPEAKDDDGDGSSTSADRVDRAAAVRELAGLFSNEETQPRRQRPPSAPADPAPEESSPPPIKRLEDDDEISKGLIGRFIDGVKGM